MKWIVRAPLIALLAIAVIISAVLVAIAFVCLTLHQKVMRTFNGACPNEGCCGWKVLRYQVPAEGGVNRVHSCSNEEDPFDPDGGCPWYETKFVSMGEIVAEMRAYLKATTGCELVDLTDPESRHAA